ncbi:hypothetical protein J2Z40_003869 [Cytobacillus eiseniae]|uniref:DUF5071 domain-containing protein n=1 Tax=Cytobacillus eiseniae TaxID=762947 RepID=A0ABS4RLN4_9BACI|nr:DUF5071 domain-containing protein [Cytobacillus eiseniae]MBP2243270.1 hypothetical protein [Cytobacillus eiseniae]
MKDYTNLLPRNKHDFDRVDQLKKMNRIELLPLLPGLLEWIQDMNWPIAHEVAELLLTFPNEMVPLIQDVFATNDEIWKYWCLDILIKRLPKEIKVQLKDELIRLVERPTVGEKYEELDEMASEILSTIG